MQDELPARLDSGSAVPLRYTVRIANAQGRSAGESREAVTAAGAAPPGVQGLAATTTGRGIQLTWHAISASADPLSTVRIEAAGGSGQRSLAVAEDAGGAIDAVPKVGDTVTYTVVRSRTVDGMPPLTLMGEAAHVTVTRAADTFPPFVPVGLTAVGVQLEPASPEIDLSWEPNSDADLTGYLVERTEVGSAAGPVLLTPEPIGAESYRDRAVQPGHTYRYTVRAQDAAGNRSKPSVAATEILRP